ncbi:MAG: FkbM family methyltransferase [Desulfobaccales bacterium]|nr:FkbM family methyltransferase [Desulfobaccales bacterium]
MKILFSIWFFLEDLEMILRNQDFHRGRLLLEYLKLKIKQIIQYKSSNTTIKYTKIFGFNVQFYNYKALIYMVKEVFIKSQYHFETDSKEPFIIDCGANIGIPLLSFKMRYPGARIIAFEPERMAFKVLSANVENNKLKNVHLMNKAIYIRPGKLSFYYDAKNYASSISSTVKGRVPDACCEEVDAVLLSDYIDRPVNFLKMDIEGAEGLIIAELASRNKLKLINEMVVEYHHHINPNEDNFSKILKILEDNDFGYQIISLDRRVSGKRLFQDMLIYAYRKA